MKKNILFIILLFLLKIVAAQDVTFTFANPQNTNDGTDDFYEVDVLIESTTGFKLGAGLLYFDYNATAFGPSIFANGNITITYPNSTSPSYLLGSEAFPGFGFYNSFITNDNTPSRVAFSWQQALSSGMIPGNNVAATAVELFHLKIKYVDVNQDPMMCFESSPLLTDQTFTACGGTTFADCPGFPGIQITNDNFDCSGASLLLPVELISFRVKKEGTYSLLEWKTAQETNNMGFEIQRLDQVNDRWEIIGFKNGAGDTDIEQAYTFYDETPLIGYNYYRLNQIDFDGTASLSEVRVVEFKMDEDQSVMIYPNPASSVINIESSYEDYDIQVYSSLGQLLLTTANKRQIDISTFAAGTYYFKIHNRQNNRYKSLSVEVMR